MRYKAFVPYSDKHGYQEFYFDAPAEAKHAELYEIMLTAMGSWPKRMFNPKLALIVQTRKKEGEKK